MIAANKGYKELGLMNRFTKKLTKEFQDNIVHIIFMFGGAIYPSEGNSFEVLLEPAQTRLYQNRDMK
ncbi:hypothetical protein M3215_09310 [Bacillus cytotoxicus]|uniref:Uncharacterized protein n=1 Tax=Bacillus cytotoxicus TaxID=580165 RepID=A0ACC6A6Y3_9BACI|nr:hypothetical protein [Bacillus cytotoxicus]